MEKLNSAHTGIMVLLTLEKQGFISYFSKSFTVRLFSMLKGDGQKLANHASTRLKLHYLTNVMSINYLIQKIFQI